MFYEIVGRSEKQASLAAKGVKQFSLESIQGFDSAREIKRFAVIRHDVFANYKFITTYSFYYIQHQEIIPISPINSAKASPQVRQ